MTLIKESRASHVKMLALIKVSFPDNDSNEYHFAALFVYNLPPSDSFGQAMACNTASCKLFSICNVVGYLCVLCKHLLHEAAAWACKHTMMEWHIEHTMWTWGSEQAMPACDPPDTSAISYARK